MSLLPLTSLPFAPFPLSNFFQIYTHIGSSLCWGWMCGNFGLLILEAVAGNEPLSAHLEQVLTDQLDRTRVRGGQAGGLSLMTHVIGADGLHSPIKSPAMDRIRIVPMKRSHFANELFKALRNKKALLELKRLHGVGDQVFVSCIGHSRFATSSP